MINKRARLSRLEKIFITEDLTDAQIGVTPDSFFCGRQVEYRLISEQIFIMFSLTCPMLKFLFF